MLYLAVLTRCSSSVCQCILRLSFLRRQYIYFAETTETAQRRQYISDLVCQRLRVMNRAEGKLTSVNIRFNHFPSQKISDFSRKAKVKLHSSLSVKSQSCLDVHYSFVRRNEDGTCSLLCIWTVNRLVPSSCRSSAFPS